MATRYQVAIIMRRIFLLGDFTQTSTLDINLFSSPGIKVWEEQSVHSLVAVHVITIWAKVSKRGRSHVLLITLASADFMEVAFAVGLDEKLMQHVIVRIFVICAIKRTCFRTVTQKLSSEGGFIKYN